MLPPEGIETVRNPDGRVGLVLNQSRITEFLACQVKYQLGYEEARTGLRPKTVKLALSIGSSYHKGAAVYYHSNRNIHDAMEAARTDFLSRMETATIMAAERSLWDEGLATILVMLKCYDQRWGHEALEVLAPEVVGMVRVGDSPHHLKFKADAVVQEYGIVKLLDHKTKGRTPSALEIAAYHNRIQPTAYLYGTSKLMGLNVQGVKIRFAIKKPEYDINRMHFEEFTARSQRDLERFEQQFIDTADRIMELRQSGKWLHNFEHCTTYGECDFRRICLHHRDPSIMQLFIPREADYVDEEAG